MSSFVRFFSLKYSNGSTFVHRIDPRVKVVFFLMYSFTLALEHTWSAVILLGFIAAVSFPASGQSLIPLLRNLRGILVFCVLLGILQIFFQQGGRSLWAWGVLQVTETGLVAAVVMTLKILFFICFITLFTQTTQPAKLMLGLHGLLFPLKRLGIPVDEFVFMMTLAFNYIPFLAEEIDRIATALRARGKQPPGWDWVGRFENALTMLVPIFSSTLRRAETMASALESRGCRGVPHSVSIVRKRLSIPDVFVLAAALMLPLTLIISG